MWLISVLLSRHNFGVIAGPLSPLAYINKQRAVRQVQPFAVLYAERSICPALTPKFCHFNYRTLTTKCCIEVAECKLWFRLFSRITAIRKDSKNRKSGSVSLLTNYCSCCFLLSQTTLFSQQIRAKRSFAESFLHALLFLEKAGGTA